MSKHFNNTLSTSSSQDTNPVFYSRPTEFVMSLRGLTGNQKSILYSLAERMGKNGKAWPSLTTLSKDSGVTIRTITRSLKILEEKKILKITRPNSQHNSNIYQFLGWQPSTIQGGHHGHLTLKNLK